MDEIDFSEVLSSEAFDAIKGTVTAFLQMQGTKNASLEYKDKTVYLHADKDSVQIHITSGEKAAPDLPGIDEDEE